MNSCCEAGGFNILVAFMIDGIEKKKKKYCLNKYSTYQKLQGAVFNIYNKYILQV